jgi:hypothetical protein
VWVLLQYNIVRGACFIFILRSSQAFYPLALLSFKNGKNGKRMEREWKENEMVSENLPPNSNFYFIFFSPSSSDCCWLYSNHAYYKSILDTVSNFKLDSIPHHSFNSNQILAGDCQRDMKFELDWDFFCIKSKNFK